MIKKNSKLFSENIDGLIYLFDTEKQISYDFEQVASDIWILLDKNSLEDIPVILFEKYEIDIKTLKKDVANFISGSLEIGLLVEQ